jgi:hypothetical protein
VRVVGVSGEGGTLERSDGTRSTWRLDDPRTARVLARNRGEQVLVFWQRRGAVMVVVGVSGPRGSVPPSDLEPAAAAS